MYSDSSVAPMFERFKGKNKALDMSVTRNLLLLEKGPIGETIKASIENLINYNVDDETDMKLSMLIYKAKKGYKAQITAYLKDLISTEVLKDANANLLALHIMNRTLSQIEDNYINSLLHAKAARIMMKEPELKHSIKVMHLNHNVDWPDLLARLEAHEAISSPSVTNTHSEPTSAPMPIEKVEVDPAPIHPESKPSTPKIAPTPEVKEEASNMFYYLLISIVVVALGFAVLRKKKQP